MMNNAKKKQKKLSMPFEEKKNNAYEEKQSHLLWTR